MPSPWFFVSVLPDVGEAWPLSREEAKHALGARRLEAGDEVVLFDGRGGIAEGRIEGTRLRDGSVPVLVASRRSERWRGRAVHCATALPKGDRLATLVDMTAQLGVASLTPLRCERSVVGETANRAERIRRIQIEACKQARSAWLPELCEETTPGTLAAAHRGRLLVAQPRGARPREIAAELGDSCTDRDRSRADDPAHRDGGGGGGGVSSRAGGLTPISARPPRDRSAPAPFDPGSWCCAGPR
jgi:16S rRNA (uracil1498-N3)-methyltransferase